MQHGAAVRDGQVFGGGASIAISARRSNSHAATARQHETPPGCQLGFKVHEQLTESQMYCYFKRPHPTTISAAVLTCGAGGNAGAGAVSAAARYHVMAVLAV